MGQQQSSNVLNCKNTSKDKSSQVIATKQLAIQINKRQKIKQKANSNQSQTLTRVNSSKMLSPRNISQVSINSSPNNINSKSSKNIFAKTIQSIPQHESVIKVSLTQFANSVHSTLKQNPSPYFFQPKLKTLGQIIESRYRTTKHLPYSQILNLMQSLVYGCAYFSKKKICFHDYYPTNIYYCNGKFKIQNPIVVDGSGFSLTVQRKRFSFLSPELIIALLENINQQQIGEQALFKSDVFSIGMILLQACSLEPSSECYDQENYNIIDSIIRQRVAKIAKVYTPLFAECVNLMLQYQVQYRLNPVLLSQIVQTKIQQQKRVSAQMQNQNLSKHQNQQMIQKQPPYMNVPQKPIAYNHQPFKLQNINQNSIAVPLPDQVYSRIGPNNQGFLSASTLQNKLRVIQLIHQNSKEEQQEEEQQILKIPKAKTNYQHQSLNTFSSHQLNSSNNEDTKYPFVQSIYSKQTAIQKKQKEEQSQNKKLNINTIDQRFVDVKLRPQINIQTNIQRKPFYPISPKNITPNLQLVNNITPNNTDRYQHQNFIQNPHQPYQFRDKQTQFINKQGYVTSVPANSHAYKYGTSYQVSNGNIQGQTLQARVERVLKMSRNVN